MKPSPEPAPAAPASGKPRAALLCWPRLLAKAGDYAQLARMHKPIGSFLLLWPTLWALWLAGHGQPPEGTVLVFCLGVFLMRSAGCVMNDIADRRFDPHVARTRDRPLAAGRVTVREALWLAIGLSLVAFGLVLTQNGLTIGLSFAGLALAAGYPLMKRLHHLPQVVLGMAFGWGIPMAFAAVTGSVPALAWLLYAANIVWSVAYDTFYAMTDREDDLKIGVKSSAILFGARDRQIVALLQGAFLLLLGLAGLMAGCGPVYYLGLFAAAWLMAWEQYLVRRREPAACFHAFLHNNWVGLAVFAGVLVDALP